MGWAQQDWGKCCKRFSKFVRERKTVCSYQDYTIYKTSRDAIKHSSSVFLPNSAAVPSGGVGVLTGALILYCTKSKGRRVAIINWIIALLTILPVLGAFLVSCPNFSIAGINTPYANRYI